jgi:hypothetical protein
MPNRSRKQKLPDPNTTAFGIVQALSGETPPPADDGKDPAAGALGRKGGKARAERMTKAQRVAAAKKAAAARWGKK